MTIVACVLRSGGEYRVEHVERLAKQVGHHAPFGTGFLCMTDQPVEVSSMMDGLTSPLDLDCLVLAHNWPRWFAKLELYGQAGPILYLDLDVTVMGSLEPLLIEAMAHDLIACRDFWHPELHGINTSVVGWRGDAGSLCRAFAGSPVAHESIYDAPGKWGDQGFVRDHWRGDVAMWQDLLPGMVMSYKRGVLLGEDPSDCRVLVSHGRPRPWDTYTGADAWLAAREGK